MTTREIRLKAAEILEASEDSWCQGAFRRDLLGCRYSYCLIGACQQAAGYWASLDANDWNAVGAASFNAAAAIASIGSWVLGPNISVAVWNDAPGRTREEVIAALRAVD